MLLCRLAAHYVYNEKQVKKQPALWFFRVQAAFLLVSLSVSVTAAFLVQAQKHRARQRHQHERQHHGFVVIRLPHLAQMLVNQRGERLPFGARQEQGGGKFADTGGGGKRHAAPQCGGEQRAQDVPCGLQRVGAVGARGGGIVAGQCVPGGQNVFADKRIGHQNIQRQ